MPTDLKSIKAFVASVSGVLTNNQDIVGQIIGGTDFKGFARSHYDGQGVSLLRAIGIRVAFITVDPKPKLDGPLEKIIDGWNTLPSSLNGWPRVHLIHGVVGEEQIAPVLNWLMESGHTFDDCAVMGHDLVQIPLLRKAGLKVAPSQAQNVAKKEVDIITSQPGGNGALREFVDLVLEARGIDPTTLPTR